MLMLIRELYGEPVDEDLSRAMRERAVSYMGGHFKSLAEYLDKLASHNAESIDALAESVFRGLDTQKARAKSAVTAFGWHALFAPFTREQQPYINSERLLEPVLADADALHTYSVYIVGGLNADNYVRLKALDAELAADYAKYSLAFAYENLANNDVTCHLKLEPDPDVSNPLQHLLQGPSSWLVTPDEGK